MAATINYAQNPAIPAIYQEQAREELKKIGLEEEAVNQRLLEKGIDINNITLDNLPQFQAAIEEVIADLESEKQDTSETPLSPLIEDTTTELITEGVALDIEQDTATIIDTENQAEEVALPKRWGQLLFTNTFSSTQNIANAPNSYILSTGDELTISIFGSSQLDARFEIGPAGYIKPSKIPKIFLKGISLGEAKELLRNRFAKYYVYAKNQFTVSVTSPRLININVFGEVNKYGTLRLPGINTAINALTAAKGPNDIGSVRNISLIRGAEKKSIDVYAFMEDPTLQTQYYLEDGDIIHVPVAERLVEIEGAVRRPMQYELKGDEQLKRLLKFAGGLTANAYKNIIQIERYEEDTEVMVDVKLQQLLSSGQDYPLRNGDKIIIRTIPKTKDNFATISGAIDLPGAYSLKETPRLSDLLTKGQLKREARLDLAFLTRENLDGTNKVIQLNITEILANKYQAADLYLERRDSLAIYFKERFVDASTISVKGAVRDTLEYTFASDSTITVSQAILLAGGLSQDAYTYGYITRKNPNNSKEVEYVPINVQEVLSNPNSASNFLMKANDELRILSNATFQDEASVSISGAVRQPGSFQYDETLTLKDVLRMSGGFKLSAALNRIDLYRLEMQSNQPTKTIVTTLEVDSLFQTVNGIPMGVGLQPFDEIVVRSIPEFEPHQFVEIEGEVTYPGKYALLDDNETITSLLKRAGGLTPEAFASGANLFQKNELLMVTRLDEVLKNPSSKYNYILQDGDRLVIPKDQRGITIKTNNTRASELYPNKNVASGLIQVAYEKGKRADWYIKEYAVGFGDNAARKKVFVELANGELKRTKNFILFKQYPTVEKGATIAVGPKPPKRQKRKEDRKAVNWEKIIATTFQAISLGVTTILLVQRL